MKTLVGNVMRAVSVNGDGTMGVAEQGTYAKWYADRSYTPFLYTVKYMSPMGMPRKYGFWALPTIYAKVLIGLPDNSNPNEWVYLGSIYDTPTTWDKDVPYYSTLQEKNIKSVVAPFDHAYATNVQSQAYGMITPLGNSFVLSDNTSLQDPDGDNKGVFLNTYDGKGIHMHALGKNNVNDSIVIQTQKASDSITLTGPESKKPLGPRGYQSTTNGNSITQSRGGSLHIQVGMGNQDETGNGRTLTVRNLSMAYGGGSKTMFEAGNIPDLKAEGCGSVIIQADNNDVEIISAKERVLILANSNCQIKTFGETKIISVGDITLQSEEGDINLKALKGKVNIESGDMINIDSGADIDIQSAGKIDLNKSTPSEFTPEPIEEDKFNVVELKEKLDSGEIKNPATEEA